MIKRVSSKIDASFSILETLLAIIIIIGVVLSSFTLFFQLRAMVVATVTSSHEFFNYELFKKFISFILILVIGVELGEMLIRRNPGTIIEILLLAIARKLLIYSEHSFEFVLGVLAIGGLFAIRRYLFLEHFSPRTQCVLGANTPLQDANSIIGVHLPIDQGAMTLGGLVHQLAKRHHTTLKKDALFFVGDAEIKILDLDQGMVTQMQVKRAGSSSLTEDSH